MKFKATIEIFYEITSDSLKDYYDTDDPKRAAEIDQSNFNNDPSLLFELIEKDQYTLSIIPVE